MRQHQRQINFMTKYSKSLGGGKIVQREVIVKEKKGGGVEGEKENSAASKEKGEEEGEGRVRRVLVEGRREGVAVERVRAV